MIQVCFSGLRQCSVDMARIKSISPCCVNVYKHTLTLPPESLPSPKIKSSNYNSNQWKTRKSPTVIESMLAHKYYSLNHMDTLENTYCRDLNYTFTILYIFLYITMYIPIIPLIKNI